MLCFLRPGVVIRWLVALPRQVILLKPEHPQRAPDTKNLHLINEWTNELIKQLADEWTTELTKSLCFTTIKYLLNYLINWSVNLLTN